MKRASESPGVILVGLSGSLRAHSTNHTLLAAAARLAPDGTEVRLYEGVGNLPHYNPDVDVEPLPAEVAHLRAIVREADGLAPLILSRCCPQSQLPRFCRCDSACLECLAVSFQHSQASGGLFPCSKADEPNDAAMTSAVHNRELTEVLVQSNEDAALKERGF